MCATVSCCLSVSLALASETWLVSGDFRSLITSRAMCILLALAVSHGVVMSLVEQILFLQLDREFGATKAFIGPNSHSVSLSLYF